MCKEISPCSYIELCSSFLVYLSMYFYINSLILPGYNNENICCTRFNASMIQLNP